MASSHRAGEIEKSALFRPANDSPRKSLNNSHDDTATAPKPIIGHAASRTRFMPVLDLTARLAPRLPSLPERDGKRNTGAPADGLLCNHVRALHREPNHAWLCTFRFADGQEDLADSRNRHVIISVRGVAAPSALDPHSISFPTHRTRSRRSSGQSDNSSARSGVPT